MSDPDDQVTEVENAAPTEPPSPPVPHTPFEAYVLHALKELGAKVGKLDADVNIVVNYVRETALAEAASERRHFALKPLLEDNGHSDGQ